MKRYRTAKPRMPLTTSYELPVDIGDTSVKSLRYRCPSCEIRVCSGNDITFVGDEHDWCVLMWGLNARSQENRSWTA